MENRHVVSLTIVFAVGIVLVGACRAPDASAPSTATQPPASVRSKTAPNRVAVSGVVRDANGSPVAAAVVAVVRDDASVATAVAISATDGSFTFSVAPGKYAFTATSVSHAAAHLDVAKQSGNGEVELRLGVEGDVHRGSVHDESGAPWPNRRVRIQRASRLAGDVYYCDTDSNGNFEVKLPRAVGYQFSVDVVGKVPVFKNVAGKPTQRVKLAMPSIASDQVITWIRHNAIRLTTAEAGKGFADLRMLKPSIGDARIVALGEATHGSREFRQIRRRLLEYLVVELGFNALAVESSFATSLAVNDYVLGKPASMRLMFALRARQASQPETFAAIEWMRRYNANPAHKNKVRFIGVDMQRTPMTVRKLAAYFDTVDPAYGKHASKETAWLLDRRATRAYSKSSAAQRTKAKAGLGAIIRRLVQKKAAYIKASNKHGWQVARQLAQNLVQAEQMYAVMVGANTAAFNVRDRAMAENTKWILDTLPPGARVVYWAHNGHVAGTHPHRKPQGSHLRDMFGRRYLSVATTFSTGSFGAVGRKNGRPTKWEKHTADRALPGTVGNTLRRVGHAILFLDMRRRPKSGPVAQWFRKPHPIRSIGAVFMGERLSYNHLKLPNAWDALIFIRKTTATLPLRDKRRK